MEHGSISRDTYEILDKWKRDYEILFNNNSNNQDFDQVFLIAIKTENTQKEQIMLNNESKMNTISCQILLL